MDLISTTSWHTEEVVEDIVQGVNVDCPFANNDIISLSPSHVVRLLQEVVAQQDSLRPAASYQTGCLRVVSC